MAIVLRFLIAEDLAFAHRLSHLAGWNQTRHDWERFLALAPDACFLAESDGESAGTATTTSYGTDLAWIGMVLVSPEFRRRGMGTALLNGAIRHLREERGIACVRLDATPEGQPLYESLGFQAEWGMRRWVREPGSARTAPTSPPFSDWNLSLTLDREVFGADRSELLASLAAGSREKVTLPDGSFGLMREGERALYLGPITAASTGSGLGLAEQLIFRCPEDSTVFWDLPDPNVAATELAERLGFRPVRVLTRMWLGDAPAPCDPQRIFGIAEPGLG